MAEIRLSGRPASSGFAEGQLYVLPGEGRDWFCQPRMGPDMLHHRRRILCLLGERRPHRQREN